MSNFVDIGLYIAYALVALGALLLLGFNILRGIDDIKKWVRPGIAFASVLFLFLISYSLASGDIPAIYEDIGMSRGIVRIVGAMLIQMYLMMFLAFVGILYNEVIGIIKKG